EHPDYIPLFLLTLAVMLVSIGFLFFRLNEPKAVRLMEGESRTMGVVDEAPAADGSTEKMPRDVFCSLCFILASVFLWFMGYNAVTTAFSKYAAFRWGMKGGDYALVLMIAQAAAILTYLPVGMIASKFGRKKTILMGIVLLAVAFSAGAFFSSFSGMIFFFFALAGMGWAFINVNSYPMVVEMSRGADVGKYTGYYYTFSMTAQIITPIVSGAVMQYLGYQYLFPYGAFFVTASFITMLFVKHGDSRPAAKKGIEALDVDD
ncbi:MAG: MFS transporter, partial [Pygmaiobacter sp.]